MLSNIDLTAALKISITMLAGNFRILSDRLNEAMLYLRVINQAKALRLDRAVSGDASIASKCDPKV